MKCKKMQVRTPKDIGAAIRDWRKKRGLDQAELARRVGVNRRWIVEVEKGKPRAAQNLMLKTFEALGVEISIAGADEGTPRSGRTVEAVDIDAIVGDAKESKQ
jgi:HTH-type transcriptional regulator/antitoxin HipB